MDIKPLLTVAALSLALALPALAEDEEAAPVPAAPAAEEAPPASDGPVEKYLEKHGERLEKEMQDVMEPMKKNLEGIQGDQDQEQKGQQPRQQK